MKGRMLRTIFRRKESATENRPPGLHYSGKGEKVGQEPTAMARDCVGRANPFRCKTK